MSLRRLLHLLVVVSLVCGGLTLSPASPALATGTQVSSNTAEDDFWPAVAMSPDGSKLVAIWNQGLSIYVSTSTNNGNDWSPDLKLGNFPADVERSRIAFDSNGNLHATWNSGQSTGRTVNYWYVPAGADTTVFSNWVKSERVCVNCIKADMAVDRSGNVYVSYENRDQVESKTGIKRTNGIGNGWGTPREIPEAGQAGIAVTPDGKLHMAYLNQDKNIVYARYTSFDSFNREFGETINSATSNKQPEIAGDANNHAHIVFLQDGETGRHAHYREFDGTNLSGITQIGANPEGNGSEFIDVAADNQSNVYVTWSGNISGAASERVWQNARISGTWGARSDYGARQVTNERARYSRYGITHNGSIMMVFTEVAGPFSTKFLRMTGGGPGVGTDNVAPSITGVTFNGLPGLVATTQRVNVTVTATDTAPSGVTPSGVTTIEYSLNNSDFVVGATVAAGVTVSPTFNLDLANPAAGGSWANGARNIFFRALDAAGNVSTSAQQQITLTSSSIVTRYLAEGYTGGTFDEYLSMTNPSSTISIQVSVTFQYAGTSSGIGGTLVDIGPNQRKTLFIDEIAGTAKELSLKLESDQPFFAERPMYFQNYPSASAAAYNRPNISALSGINGGHLGVAAVAPGADWYFAEGYTGEGFEAYFTIQNPQAAVSNVQITYYLAGGGVQTKNLTIAASQRRTVVIHDPNDPGGLGTGQAFSAKVSTTNGQNIIVERVMYFRYTSDFDLGRGSLAATGGTATLGANAPATNWSFAEGFTGAGFDQFVTIQNPGAAGSATLTYFIEGEGSQVKTIALQANSRTTVAVHNASDPGGIGRGKANSLQVSSTVPVVVERPMYFLYTGPNLADVDGGHNVMGATSLVNPGQTTYLVEGYTGAGFNEYLTFQNPNAGPVDILITYLKSDGTTVVKPLTLAASQRTTVVVHSSSGAGLGLNQETSVKVLVSAGAPGGILVERVMYFRYGAGATGGSAAFGAR